MRRLCVFYDSPNRYPDIGQRKTARDYVGKPIEWIVCKKCQKILRSGKMIYTSVSKLFSKYAESD